MATSVLDSPPSPDRAPPDAESAGAPAQPPGSVDPAREAGQGPPQSVVRCPSCGAPMNAGGDWCLQCGAGAPGSIGARAWRPWAVALTATAVLLLAAAAAAYAALNKEPKHAPVTTATVAQAPPPAAAVPPATTPTTPAVKVPPVAKAPHVKLTTTVPPAVTTTPVTPATTPTTPAAKEPSTPTTTGGSGSEAQPAAILLDTDAASTYNPYAYSASWFGDPSLTIDGDSSTGWTAQVDPATAPALAEGVVIDLKSSKKLAAVKLITTTPGITVQVYGAAAKTAPASITDKAWVPLSKSVTLKKRRAKLALKNKTKAYRFVTVWLSGAPASAVGKPEAPGKVTLNEIELFPAS